MNAVSIVMNEYICWGGPIVTRADAYADGKAQGISAKALDVLVFGRQAVEAPEDPELHRAFLLRIRVQEQQQGLDL